MAISSEKKEYLRKENLKKYTEAVNHPAHYQKGGKECIEWMEEIYGKVAVYFFCILNSYKYDFRAGEKANNPAEQDHKKSIWYIEYSKNLYKRMNFIQKLLVKILKVK